MPVPRCVVHPHPKNHSIKKIIQSTKNTVITDVLTVNIAQLHKVHNTKKTTHNINAIFQNPNDWRGALTRYPICGPPNLKIPANKKIIHNARNAVVTGALTNITSLIAKIHNNKKINQRHTKAIIFVCFIYYFKIHFFSQYFSVET